MAPTIELRGKGKLLAHRGPVIYAVRNADADPDEALADIRQVAELIEQLLAQHPSVAMLMIVEHGTVRPGPDERQTMRTVLEQFGDRLVVGYALCGLGFWAGALRSVLVAISRWAGSPVIAQATVEAAAQQLATELIGLDPELMTREAEQLRAELAGQGSRAAVG